MPCRHLNYLPPTIRAPQSSLIICSASNTPPPAPDGDPSSRGDETLQERLVDILRVQINQKEVEDFAEQKKEQLTQAAEEVCTFQGGSSGTQLLHVLRNLSFCLLQLLAIGPTKPSTPSHPQIKDQVDDFARQQAEASEVAFGNVLDDMNRKVDEFEEELRKNRQRVEVG